MKILDLISKPIYGWATVSCIGIVAAIGWVLDIGVIKSLYPGWVSMKFLTAICFSLIGLSGVFFTRSATIATSLAILTLCFCSHALGVETQVLLEGRKIPLMGFKDDSSYTIFDGVPSLTTVGLFIVVSWYMILRLEGMRKKKCLGIVISVLASFPIVGFIFDTPIMMYYITGVSTAMALHTSVAFLIIGVTINKDNREAKNEWKSQ